MKSVLRSAKPYWIYLILTGKKTVEVGKGFSKSEDWNKVVEMYCSKDMRSFNRIPERDREWVRKYLGKVVCRFVCDKVEQFTVGSLGCDDIEKQACLSHKEMLDYFYKPNELDGETIKFGYGWHISDLKIYDKPKELSEFAQYKKGIHCNKCEKWNDDCRYYEYEDDVRDQGYCVSYKDLCPLTCPPQSWCYVEELS